MRAFLATLFLMAITAAAHAVPEPLKIYVNDFKVVGAPNGNELGTILPSILASKLSPGLFTLVAQKELAEVEIFGSYVVFGKIFTLDTTVKSYDEQLFVKAFEQGEKEDDIPAALDRLAAKIGSAVTKTAVAGKHKLSTAVTLPPSAPAPAASTRQSTDAGKGAFSEVWSSQPLDGAMVAIATGRKFATGEREIFVAGERSIYYYLMGNSLKQAAKIDLPKSFKIIGVDSADLDGDGIPEIYLTAVDRGTLASLVYIPKEGKLENIAESLPYYFRGFSPGGGAPRIFVQEMGMSADFYGEILELTKDGVKFSTKSPLKLPEAANIYNFSRFSADAAGNLFAIINSEGYLVVKADKGDEIWQSIDRFGGSETYFKREAMEQQRSNMGEEYRWVFLQQRIFVTSDGSLILPRNEGSLMIGNMRSYNKHSLHLLKWNGAVLREQLKSGQRPGYLADYFYDPAAKELITLEVTKKEGMINKGRSIINVLKIEQ